MLMREPFFDLGTVPALQEIIVDETTRLRPFVESDTPRTLEILEADPSIRERVVVASRIHTPEDVAREVKSYSGDPNFIRYAALRNDAMVGMITLWRDNGFLGTNPDPYTFGFGYFLDPLHRRQGIVTKSLSRIMGELQSVARVDEYIAFCEQDNKDSAAVLTSLGLVATGELISEPVNGWAEEKYRKKLLLQE